MATRADVRRIALSFPGTVESKTDFAFAVMDKAKARGFAWVWKERVLPKQPRVPQPKVLAVRTANLAEKELILASNTRAFFTEPHYNGFPAVLVRLAEIRVAELRILLEGAWRCVAPKSLLTPEGGQRAHTARATRRNPAGQQGDRDDQHHRPADGRRISTTHRKRKPRKRSR
jgi:hypothetical protein